MAGWLNELELSAPTVTGAYKSLLAGSFIAARRAIRQKSGHGSALTSAAELQVTAHALTACLQSIADELLEAPGGEEGWNVAQAVGHVTTSRAGLALAASLAASGRWPADAPTVVPGVPGPGDRPRQELIVRIALSQRVIDRSARAVSGHEMEPCPLVHPQVGRLRCGEWLVFAGVHDLMHLEQLHRLARRRHAPAAP